MHSALADDVSPERPLVFVLERYQKGGYKTVATNNLIPFTGLMFLAFDNRPRRRLHMYTPSGLDEVIA